MVRVVRVVRAVGVVRGASLGLGRVGRVERDGDSGGAAHFLQVADAIELQATLYTPITPVSLPLPSSLFSYLYVLSSI